jgi:hypothetical protein
LVAAGVGVDLSGDAQPFGQAHAPIDVPAAPSPRNNLQARQQLAQQAARVFGPPEPLHVSIPGAGALAGGFDHQLGTPRNTPTAAPGTPFARAVYRAPGLRKVAADKRPSLLVIVAGYIPNECFQVRAHRSAGGDEQSCDTA